MGCGKHDCGCGDGDPMAMMAEIAAPDQAHQLLTPFVGAWNAEVKFWWEGSDEPHVSTGVMLNDWILGGRWIEQRYRSDDGMFAGMGLMGYNKTTGKFEGLWIDSASTMMQFETGDHNSSSNTFEMTSQMLCPQTRVPLLKRSVLRIQSEDRHTMESYFKSATGPEQKTMEITFVRR